MAGIAIKPVQAHTDTGFMAARLVHQLLDELSAGRGPDLSELEATASELLVSGAVFGMIALDGENPVGVVMWNECASIYAGGRFGEVTELYVIPGYRSRGLASRLMEETKKAARLRGWTRLEVGAPDQPTWRRTLSFYLREGFAEVGPRLKLKL